MVSATRSEEEEGERSASTPWQVIQQKKARAGGRATGNLYSYFMLSFGKADASMRCRLKLNFVIKDLCANIAHKLGHEQNIVQCQKRRGHRLIRFDQMMEIRQSVAL
jgi:hypothetical protein